MRRAIIVVLTLALLLPVGLLAQGAAADPVDVPGLEGPARVDRDGNGIAHVRAGTRHDVFFLQGWVHAQDRLFQMDVARRQAERHAGRALGAGRPADRRQLRTLGLHRAAPGPLAGGVPRRQGGPRPPTRDGVNAWVADRTRCRRSTGYWPSRRPAVDRRRQRGRRRAPSRFGLAFELDIERTHRPARRTIQAGPRSASTVRPALSRSTAPVRAVRRRPRRSPTPRPTRPVARSGRRPSGWRAICCARRRPAAETLEPARRRPAHARRLRLRPMSERPSSPIGSNQWALSGEVAVGGHPLHGQRPPPRARTRRRPSIRSTSGAGGFDAVGERLPRRPDGDRRPQPAHLLERHRQPDRRHRHLPGAGPSRPVLARAAWLDAVPGTARARHPRARDLPAANPGSRHPRQASCGPAGRGRSPPATLIVPRRNNGPIVRPRPAARHRAQRPVHRLRRHQGARARSSLWDDAAISTTSVGGLERFDVGVLNGAYPTSRAHRLLRQRRAPCARTCRPTRSYGLPPFFIRDGAGGNGGYRCTNPQYRPGACPYEILRVHEMPQLLNPPAGFFVNANNDPAGVTLEPTTR